MAEHLFRLRAGADSPWRTESAGLAAADGWPASDGAIAAMREVGVNLSAHRSRAATAAILGAADRIFVMTSGHLQEVASRFPGAAAKTELLTAHRSAGAGGDIADPIGQSVFVYRSVRNEMDSAIADILLVLRAEAGAGRSTTKS